VGDRAGGGLLERERELEALGAAFAEVSAGGRGRVVLVAGEAGIGKTALVGAFRSSLEPGRVLAGACEPLSAARPLGPLVDVAGEVGGELAERVAGGGSPGDVLAALAAELRRRPPTLLLLEDLHWADEATLDVVRLLARRIGDVAVLVVVTYRDDQLERDHPLRVALGELPPAAVARLPLAPLSPEAVAALARPYGVDAGELHARTAGNPFFVTEALAAGGALPASVRDAVLARAARLGRPARALLDAVAVVPQRAELRLLEALVEGELSRLEECLASGMLRAERDAVAFRHEIARVAVEEALPPDRRIALHRRALAALESSPGRADPARLAHHAEGAGDAEAVLRYAREAGERAALVHAHREAAKQLARALRHADALPSLERAQLLERRSYECYLTECVGEAIEARREALAVHERRGDRRGAGDAHRWLSRLFWFAGDNAAAEASAARAVALLEALPPGRELAMAYSNVAQLRMLAGDVRGAREWGGRALELAERLGEEELAVHALNNVGSAELGAGIRAGAGKLERSLELALAHGLEEHVARAYTNLGASLVGLREYGEGDRWLGLGVAYCAERDLDSWRRYMTGWRARSELEQGRWDDAAAAAHAVLDRPAGPAPSRITPLVTLGRLRARRGDPDAWAPLDEALALARGTGELQRLGPVAAARAEARWLAGTPELVAGEVEEALALARAVEHDGGWVAGELELWLARAGGSPSGAVRAAEPLALELADEPEAAARAWRALGCPYEAALALLGSDDEAALRESLAELERLGAGPAAERAARALRARGVRNLRHGPRRSTRGNPAGLTGRQLEVLRLLAEGQRNAQIAERLVLSRKTVDHHVSAILRKLRVKTRTEAAAEAGRLGILGR